MKFEIFKKEKPPIKDTTQEYFDALIRRRSVRDKLEAGRGITWDDKKDDANAWIQAEVETTYGSTGTHYTPDATDANGWLVSQWHQALQDGHTQLAQILETLMLERQASDRLGGTVRDEELKMDLAMPPRELSPAFQSIPKREPSQLDAR